MQNDYILPNKINTESPFFCGPLKTFPAEIANMSLIVTIIPGFEINFICNQLCHNGQNSLWLKQSQKFRQFLTGVFHMLKDLGTCDKIIIPLQNLGIIKIKRVIEVHGKSPLFEHHGQSGTGAATVIQPVQ